MPYHILHPAYYESLMNFIHIGNKRALDDIILFEVKKLGKKDSSNNASETPTSFFKKMINVIKSDHMKYVDGYSASGDTFFIQSEIDQIQIRV